jgi:GMP synthase-like glutamine amidotransferase
VIEGSTRVKLAILETGVPPGDLAATFGDYPAMFRTMLGDGFDFATFDVAGGDYPARIEDYDAYLITGSPAGVYEDMPWIGRLLDFLQLARGRAKLVGICFGHQAMAQAFGGHVEKSARGWGVGLHAYPIVRREPWMDEGAATIAIPASHQDQVVLQPPGTDLIVSSLFTPYAGLAWRDGGAISFQPHPEFDPAYAKALIEARYDRAPDPDAAIASLDAPNDNARLGSWIRRFLLA